jgi:hypothetical protein
VLAKVDRALTLGLENVTRQRDRNRTRRSAVPAALELRAELEQARVSSLEERADLLRVDRACRPTIFRILFASRNGVTHASHLPLLVASGYPFSPVVRAG